MSSSAVATPVEPAPPSRRAFWWRVVLAGPLVFICAALVMSGGALWLPKGPAQIDNIVLPIVLFPAIWAAFFFYACLDRRLGRAYAVIGGLSLLHVAMIAAHLLASRTGA
ncbi:MAG TPA: hypothetical protein VGE57_06670 [Solimonas sp.]